MAVIQVVLYDMDGVLVDVSTSYRRAIAETVEQFTGHPPAPGDVQALKNAGGFNDDWRLTEALIRCVRQDVPFDEIVRAFDGRYRGPRWDGLITSEMALVTAQELALAREGRAALGVVTGRPREEARFAVERFGWQEMFDTVVVMEDVAGRGKPDPYPLELALKRLADGHSAVSSRGAAYVGDSVDDMQAARAAGCRPIGFIPPYLDIEGQEALLRDHGAETVARSHAELLEVLTALVD